ncbi:MAG: hypothetical protein K1W05_03705 [Desulfovibrio sp.]
MYLSCSEAKREAKRRFGEGTSRYQDFMASYEGIRNKAHRSTVDEYYGYGRRYRQKKRLSKIRGRK